MPKPRAAASFSKSLDAEKLSSSRSESEMRLEGRALEGEKYDEVGLGVLAGGVRLSRVGHEGKAQAWWVAGAVVVKDEGGGERARGAALRFDADEEDEDELGREKSDSESDGEELEMEGGKMVGLDGVQPTGERERELVEDELDDLRLEKLVKASMAVIIELSELGVFVVCKLGLCRLLEVESQTRMGDPRSGQSTSDCGDRCLVDRE